MRPIMTREGMTLTRIAVNRCVRFLRLLLLFDAAGLGLFAVAGTQKALIAGLNPVMAIFMGVLTGIGGGILRDVLVNQTPTVLEADIYAVAALAAGFVVVVGYAIDRMPSRQARGFPSCG